MNIYDFINDPSKAVYAGYRPSYLTCVSCVANNWWAFCRWTAGRVGRFKYVLDMTLGGDYRSHLYIGFWIGDCNQLPGKCVSFGLTSIPELAAHD